MRRRGFTVLEALLALAVMSIVASLWMRSLVAQERLVRAARRAEQGHLATDEVLRVLTATLHHSAASDPVQVHGDTSIAVATPVGVGLSCAHTTDSLFVPEANGLGVQWDIAPDSGDIVLVESVHGAQDTRTILSAARRAASTAGCAVPTWRLHIGTLATPPAGPLVARVMRPMRFVVYRASDGAWWWGERRCATTAWTRCGPAQPIAGPLAHARGGLLLTREGARVVAALRDGAFVRRAAVTRLP